jgi:hypothetical protein
VADLVPFCGGSCDRCNLMQGGTGQGKPHRSEYRVRPGLKTDLREIPIIKHTVDINANVRSE